MTDSIHLELMKYTTGCVGEFSKISSVYIMAIKEKELKKVKNLEFVKRVTVVP